MLCFAPVKCAACQRSFLLAVHLQSPEPGDKPTGAFPSPDWNRKALHTIKKVYSTSAKANTILKECNVCKKEVVISYECPNCKQRVCMLCAINSKWQCPKCSTNVV